MGNEWADKCWRAKGQVRAAKGGVSQGEFDASGRSFGSTSSCYPDFQLFQCTSHSTTLVIVDQSTLQQHTFDILNADECLHIKAYHLPISVYSES